MIGCILSKLESIEDLKPAPYNPRQISAEEMAGLKASLGAFGDISGIVWNSNTGHLVCGHQRLTALKARHGEGLRLENGALVNQDGDIFPIRVVDWEEAKEKAANVAANNPHIAGDFTPDVGGVIDDIMIELPDLADSLRLDKIDILDLSIPDDNKDINEDDLANTENECPKCGFQW